VALIAKQFVRVLDFPDAPREQRFANLIFSSLPQQ